MNAITIAAIETVPFSAPLTVPVRYGKIERRRSASVLIRLRADSGLVGYGEACAVPQLTGESAESIVSVVDLYWRNAIVGTDVMNWRRTMAEIRRRFPKSFVAMSAVETAMLDLAGKSLGVPAFCLLGGKYRERIELCASISWNASAEAMAEDAARKSTEYAVLKVYVGPDDVALDLRRLEAVRAAAGDKARIMLDAKGLWPAHTAIAAAPALKDLGVFLVEQPVAPEDKSGAAAVTRVYLERYGMLTAADESVETSEDVLQLSGALQFSSLNIGVTKMGGPEAAMRAAHVAQAATMPILIGSFAELGIATAAGIHLAAATAELVAPSYLSGPDRFTQTITYPTLLPQAGHVSLPEGAGLGVAVDEDCIAAMASMS
jgi:muconate cycloisomerase